MAEPITDRNVVAALRPFVRASTPMLAALRQSDPLGLLRRLLPNQSEPEPAEPGPEPGTEPGTAVSTEVAEADRGVLAKLAAGLDAVKVPGTTAWTAMSVEQRTDWWVNRVGRFTTLLAAVPGVGGALADRLPVQDILGSAGQGLLLCAIALEHGVTDRAEQVRLLAAVLFDRDIDPATAAGHAEDQAGEDADTAELTEELDSSHARHGKVTVQAAARTLWRFGRMLWSVSDELGKRPQGRFYHRALGMVPVVGVVGDYLGERSGLKRATKHALRWLAEHPAPPG